jgi:hypothetical protein
MSDRDWLRDFINEASRNPTRLLQTIAMAGKAELPAAAAAVDMVKSAEVKVFGYAALARRDPHQRQKFLTQAAAETAALDDPAARAGVLLALLDALPEEEAAYFKNLLEREIPDLERDVRRRFEELFRERAPAAERAKPLFELPTMRKSDVDLDLEEIAVRIADIQKRKVKKAVRGIRPISATLSEGKVRLSEIGRSLHIHPLTFEIESVLIPTAEIEVESLALPGEATKSAPERPERVVNTGFADEHGEITRIVAEPSTSYRYFIDIGHRFEEAPDSAYSLQEDLGPGTIDVVIFTNDDGLTLEGPKRGKFQIQTWGTVTVLEPAATAGREWPTRMFFAFRTPDTKSVCSMRCSFYSRGILVQSRSIVIPVGMGTEPTITPDYILSRTLSPRYLAQMESPRLSLMLNANVDGTHTLRFYGDGRSHSSMFGEGELTYQINLARAGLRLAAWGAESEWDERKDKYRFRIPQSVVSVLPDLYQLAWRGRNMWDATMTKLAGGPEEADDLAKQMQRHGSVHLALKENASHILPIALFYDYEFTPDIPKEQQKLCPSFLNSLAADDLADEPCFVGDCPSRTKGDTICPSGFWGYRHAIGLPLSIGAQQSSPAEIQPFILTTEEAFVTAGMSTDPTMSRRIAHARRLKDITGVPVNVHDTRDGTMAALATSRAPVVYFYCHGGFHPIEGPFIQVGPTGGPRIAYTNVRKVRWDKPIQPRPIVFINGCHTTAVSPEQAFDLVRAFVSESSASGVIGTEITIFESLAMSFAEAYFEEFVVKKRSAGEAIRRARLSLLHHWRNPLGLVYIPFVLPDLHLWPREQ